MGDIAASTVSKATIDELKRVGIIAQKQKDRFLIRLRTVAGDLTADELDIVVQAARTYAGSRVHLTTRQAVELHNIHVNDLQAAREQLEAGGIVLGVCGPRGRGIVACPGSATCTSGIIETRELAAELDSTYFRVPAPHKFKIGISGCPNNCSKPVENDIGIMGGVLPRWEREACISCRLCVNICPAQAISQNGKEFVLDSEQCLFCGLCIRNCPRSAWKTQRTGYTLYFGGTIGLKPRLGTRVKELVETKEEVLYLVRRAFDHYCAHGRKKERFGHMLDRIGLNKALADIFSEQDEQAPRSDESSEGRSSVRKNFLDLRGVSCPLNFVKAKLAMDRIGSGETIEFHLDDGEPLVNVTRSLKDEGHQVLLVTAKQNYFEVMVEKK